MKKNLCLMFFFIINSNLICQNKLIDIIENIPCLERKINRNNLINISEDEFDLSQFTQIFVYKKDTFFLISNTTEYILFCSSMDYDKRSMEFSITVPYYQYFFIDKIRSRCFLFCYLYPLRKHKPIVKDDHIKCIKKYTKGMIYLVSELDIQHFYLPKIDIKIDFTKDMTGDFTNLWIYNYHDEKKYEKMYEFSETNTYNIFDISYNEFLGLHSKFKATLKDEEETEVEEIHVEFEENDDANKEKEFPQKSLEDPNDMSI